MLCQVRLKTAVWHAIRKGGLEPASLARSRLSLTSRIHPAPRVTAVARNLHREHGKWKHHLGGTASGGDGTFFHRHRAVLALDVVFNTH